jgi:hypothetical protein
VLWICAASVLQVTVTAEAARRFLVARHFLAPARSVTGGLDGALELSALDFEPEHGAPKDWFGCLPT